MKNIKLTLSYDGTPFLGWQKTEMGPSIEETLESALYQILKEKSILQAASRTDAGVHAEGQVVQFSLENTEVGLSSLLRSLNGVLPSTIRTLTITEMGEAFHPTLDCTAKEYIYQICNTPLQLPFYRHLSWHFPQPLNVDQMRKAAHFLKGTHDFSTFCNERALWTRNPVCTLDTIQIEPLAHGRMQITFRGDHFLYKMVRNLAGTLVYAGAGKLQPEQIPAILQAKDRTQAGITAPAHGLTLKQVFY